MWGCWKDGIAVQGLFARTLHLWSDCYSVANPLPYIVDFEDAVKQQARNHHRC